MAKKVDLNPFLNEKKHKILLESLLNSVFIITVERRKAISPGIL